MPRPVVFLSDYGLDDEFVGVCRAVIASVAPEAPVLDLTHAVPPHDVLAGALALGRSARFLPRDAVVLAVVDPGVGTERRPLAVETVTGPILVGPDNGLLSLAWQELGGVRRAVALSNESLHRQPVSPTFHGRDVFAPVSAHLALGLPVEEAGEPVPPAELARAYVPAPTLLGAEVHARVLSVDRFGNVELNLRQQHLAGAGVTDRMSTGPYTLRRARTFGDVRPGELAFLVDSSGWVAVVANGGSAAVALGVEAGDLVILTPPEPDHAIDDS
jgi:S-adenosyl-L-methionine hydrolase (adenosine-forming)